jgi:hypothetical protein
MVLVAPITRGLQISMYIRGEHNPPHLHVKYGGRKACLSIHDLRLVKGSLPAPQLSAVRAWVAAHRDELLTMWDSRERPGAVYKIEAPPQV